MIFDWLSNRPKHIHESPYCIELIKKEHKVLEITKKGEKLLPGKIEYSS